MKYFPDGYDAYDFDEQEMNRIIACDFSLRDVQNMIRTVVKERPVPDTANEEKKDANTDAENDDFYAGEKDESEDGNS